MFNLLEMVTSPSLPQAACRYDECDACWALTRAAAFAAVTAVVSAEGGLRRQTHPHALQLVAGRPQEYRGGSARCDICKAPDLHTTHHCAACGYDECDSCFAKAAAARVLARSGSNGASGGDGDTVVKMGGYPSEQGSSAEVVDDPAAFVAGSSKSAGDSRGGDASAGPGSPIIFPPPGAPGTPRPTSAWAIDVRRASLPCGSHD